MPHHFFPKCGELSVFFPVAARALGCTLALIFFYLLVLALFSGTRGVRQWLIFSFPPFCCLFDAVLPPPLQRSAPPHCFSSMAMARLGQPPNPPPPRTLISFNFHALPHLPPDITSPQITVTSPAHFAPNPHQLSTDVEVELPLLPLPAPSIPQKHRPWKPSPLLVSPVTYGTDHHSIPQTSLSHLCNPLFQLPWHPRPPHLPHFPPQPPYKWHKATITPSTHPHNLQIPVFFADDL